MFSFLKRGKGFYADMGKLAVPIILQNLVTNSLALVDTLMVGILGEGPIAAVTLANIPVFVILLLIFGIQSGSSVLIGQYWGKRDTETINRVIGVGVYLGGGIALLFAAVMFFFPVPFMNLLTDDAETTALAAQYARIVGVSYLFNSITQVYLGAHRSMENPKLGLYILSVSMCSNTFLNWVLIFGNLGAPAMGVRGAALATTLSRVLEFAVMLGYALTTKRFRLRFSLLLRPGGALTRRYIRYATPVVVNETLWGLGASIYPTILGHMPDAKAILAAYAISGNIEKICTVWVFAIAAVAAIIVGREIGAGRASDVYEVGLALNFIALLAGFAAGLFMLAATHFVIAPYVYPVFGLSDTARVIATTMLTVTSLALSIRAFNCANIVGVLRGGGDVRAATAIDLVPLWFVALPLAWLCGIRLGVDILWVCVAMCMENVVKFFMGVHRLRSRAWINDVTAAQYQKK